MGFPCNKMGKIFSSMFSSNNEDQYEYNQLEQVVVQHYSVDVPQSRMNRNNVENRVYELESVVVQQFADGK